MRIIYITRTYATDTNAGNATGLRNYTVELLKEKYEVIVVTPSYNKTNITSINNVISIPYTPTRKDGLFERLGIYEDYLQLWSEKAYSYLKDKIYQDDILIAVSGGELGCIMLATKLKQRTGCKMIIHFHDPVDATTVNGKQSVTRFHVNRDKFLIKYIQYADEVITCSMCYKSILEKYIFPCIHYTPCIHNVYMGFRGKMEPHVSRKVHTPLKLVYAGAMSPAQGAERFIDLFSLREDVEIIYIGNISKKIKNKLNKNIKLIGPMPFDLCIKFLKEEADIGLVALSGIEFGACVPSKIFDLINLEIPILAILPDGDAKDLINNGYGVAYSGNNKEEFNFLFTTLLDQYETIKSNMHRDKTKWLMDRLFEDIYVIIDNLAHQNVSKGFFQYD